MEKDKCKRRKRVNSLDKKIVVMNIRTSKRQSEWMNENEYSPTGIFNEACKKLGFV